MLGTASVSQRRGSRITRLPRDRSRFQLPTAASTASRAAEVSPGEAMSTLTTTASNDIVQVLLPGTHSLRIHGVTPLTPSDLRLSGGGCETGGPIHALDHS